MTQIALLPKPDDLPDFNAALDHLGDVPSLLFEGLENAAYEVSQFREQHNPRKRLDSGLAASLFRFHSVKFLQEQGIDARIDGWKWTFNRLPFLGISFYYDHYHVRVLKGPGGALPGCGFSHRKKRFYRQLASNYLIGAVPHRTTANLVVLWDLTPAYDLSGLWLALPAEGAVKQQDVSAYWIQKLSHPASGMVETPQPDDPSDGLGNLIEKITDVEQDGNAGREDSTGS